MNQIRTETSHNQNLHLRKDDKEWIESYFEEKFVVPPGSNKNNNTEQVVNAYVNGNDNGTYKRSVSFFSNPYKQSVIKKLKFCTYTTTPFEIASYLRQLFSEYDSHDGHWLYIAQNWNPRSINRVIAYLICQENTGRLTIQNHAKLFTFLIKKRKKRRGIMKNLK